MLQAVESFYTLVLLGWFLAPRFLVLPGLPEAASLPAELAAVTGAAAAAVLGYLIPAIRLYKFAACPGSRPSAVGRPAADHPDSSQPGQLRPDNGGRAGARASPGLLLALR